MNLELKLGDKMISLPMHFTWEQWMRMQSYDMNKVKPHELLAVCSGLEVKEIKNADLKDVEYISEVLTRFYFSGDPKNEVILTFTHNGVEYGLQKDFGKLTYGAWVDLEVYGSSSINENIPKILSLIYYPIKGWKKDKYILEEYDDEKVSERAEEFKTIPMDIWYGASTFFLLFVRIYTDNIASSLVLKNKVETMILRGLKVLPKWMQRKLLPGFILNATKS